MQEVDSIQGIVVCLLALIKYPCLSDDKCLVCVCALKNFVSSR